MSAKARDKKLSPAEMQGASFSISSLGGIGGTAFTPIVNWPEVAILGVSRALRSLTRGPGTNSHCHRSDATELTMAREILAELEGRHSCSPSE